LSITIDHTHTLLATYSKYMVNKLLKGKNKNQLFVSCGQY